MTKYMLYRAHYRLYNRSHKRYDKTWETIKAPNPDLGMGVINDYMNSEIIKNPNRHCFECQLVYFPVQRLIRTSEWELEYPIENIYLSEYMLAAYEAAISMSIVEEKDFLADIDNFIDKSEEVAALIIKNLRKQNIIKS